MTYRCPHHQDEEPCPVKLGQEAADIVRNARNPQEAGEIAIEAMKRIAEFSGIPTPLWLTALQEQRP